MKELLLTRRVTTTFLQAIPTHIDHFDAYIYAVVKRKKGKDLDEEYGKDVRLDPCYFDWDKKSITIHIPLNINHGITSIDDLEENFFEAIEAAFLILMQGVLP
jgi:hypothetical protein